MSGENAQISSARVVIPSDQWEVVGHLVVRLVVGWILGLAGQKIFYSFDRTWRIARHNPFTQWDAVYYLDIAAKGYDLHSTPFFPLFPALIRLTHVASFGLFGYELSGLLVNVLALAGSVLVVRAFLAEILDVDSARFGVLPLLWSPASVFLLSSYNLSLLTFLTASVGLALLHKKYVVASILAALTALTHPLGLGAVLAVVLALVVAREWRKLLPCFTVSVSGFALYCAYLWVKFGSPFVFQTEQSFFTKQFTVPFASIWTSLFRVFSEDLSAAGQSGMQFVFQFEMVIAVGAALIALYLVRTLFQADKSAIPSWLAGMALYQILVSASLTFVPEFVLPESGGLTRTVSLQVPMSYSRWFLTSLGFLAVISLLTQNTPRLRSSILLGSAAFAVFLQTMFVAALRYF